MQEKIKKINLKILSIIGIILSVSALILSAIVSNSGNKEISFFDSWAVITVFLAVIYLIVFSILNLFKPRKILSILGMILSFLAVILGSIVVIKSHSITLIDKLGDFLFLFSTLFLGIISIVSFLKAPKQRVVKPSLESELSPKLETKTKTIFKKVLWIIGAILSGFIIFLIIGGLGTDIYIHLFIPDYLAFYRNPPNWYFSMQTIMGWVGFILGWLIIIFIAYKKVGRKTAKIFLIIFSLLVVVSLILHFIIPIFYDYGFMDQKFLEPYLTKGDVFWIEKFNKSIKKGDIVVSQDTMNNRIVSLVIGLPGDKIELKDGIFFINGEPLKNVSYNFYHVNGVDSNTGNYFIIVPPDSFFGILTLLDEQFADNEQSIKDNSTISAFKVSNLPNEEPSTTEQKTQEHQAISSNLCPYENSYLNSKDNLCYCKEGYIWNKDKTKCITYNEACSSLYGPHSIAGKGDSQNKFLCYCEDGFIWNKKDGKDIKCIKGIDLSLFLYKQSNIIGKVSFHFHKTYYQNN